MAKPTVAKSCGGCLLLSLLMVGCMVTLPALFPLEGIELPEVDPEAWKERDVSGWAVRETRPYVERLLKAPASASFPGLLSGVDLSTHATHEGDQVYRVRSWVDSQNSFGAMLRTSYTGRIQQVADGRWKLLELTFDE